MDMAGEVRPASMVVVVTGGDPPDLAVARALPTASRVIAADSGADTALALGLLVDVLVGDLDSVSPAGLDALTGAGALVEAHEPDKDATDLELALIAALRHGPSSIVVLGGLGGRADHEMANLLLLSGDALAGADVILRSGTCSVQVVRPVRPTTMLGSPGEVVSLMPVHGPAHGVTTSGLRWPLVDAHLAPGTTLGVSNTFLGPQATVSCTAGVLLVIQPGLAADFVPQRAAAQAPSSPSAEVPRDR